MRDKAHDDLAVTVTTDPSETTTCALNHDAETAAQVLLRIRSGRYDRPDAAMGMARSVVCPSGGATPRLGRRKAIALAGSGMLALGLVNRAAAAAPADLQLNVFRKGSPIGTHVIRFSQTGGTLKVTSQVDLRVKVAFITVYSYRQTATTIGRTGCWSAAEFKPMTTARKPWCRPKPVTASSRSKARRAATPPRSGP